jgi:hypothetical protein
VECKNVQRFQLKGIQGYKKIEEKPVKLRLWASATQTRKSEGKPAGKE